MTQKFYIKPYNEHGYCDGNANALCGSDALKQCEKCAYHGYWTDHIVCVRGGFLDILLNGIGLVAPDGHCKRFKVADQERVKQFSNAKRRLLDYYCIDMTTNQK